MEVTGAAEVAVVTGAAEERAEVDSEDEAEVDLEDEAEAVPEEAITGLARVRVDVIFNINVRL